MLPRPLVKTMSIALTTCGAAAVLVLALTVIGPMTGQLRFASVLSGSMEPALARGSLVLSRPVPAEALRVGDVVTFTAPGGALYTHRVTQVRELDGQRVLRTKGDANDIEDDWEIAVSGGTAWRPAVHIPWAGRVMTATRSIHGFEAAAVLVPLLLGASVIVGIWSRPDEEVQHA